MTCNAKLFADDTSLFTVVENPTIVANNMNHGLALIVQGAQNWRMLFNPDPQKQAAELTFWRKRLEKEYLQIF